MTINRDHVNKSNKIRVVANTYRYSRAQLITIFQTAGGAELGIYNSQLNICRRRLPPLTLFFIYDIFDCKITIFFLYL